MIERFGRIRGLRLPKVGKYQIEIWFCPRGESIPMHVHHNVESNIWFLFGKMRWAGLGKIRELTIKNFLKHWKIPAEEPHGAVVTGRIGVFLNFEKWTGTVTSASRDIELV